MKNKSTSDYSRIDEETVQIVRKSVVRATRQGRAHSNEQDDFVQQILVVLMRRSKSFDSERASWSTFVRIVAERELRVIIRRSKHSTIRNIDCGVEFIEEVEAKESTIEPTGELKEAIQATIGNLPDELRDLCESFLKTPDLRSVSSQGSKSRSTIHRRFRSMREVFRESSLHEYL